MRRAWTPRFIPAHVRSFLNLLSDKEHLLSDILTTQCHVTKLWSHMAPSVSVHSFHDADTPTTGSTRYAIIVCAFASLGGFFFGYDQGVTSGVLIMDSFLNDYCVGWHNFTYDDCTRSSSDLPGQWTSFTVWYNMVYNLGCLVGALIGGYVADRYGRRATIFSAGVLFCIGTTWVCLNPAQDHTLMYIARIVQGFGVGNSSFSLPLFGSEMAPKELRARLSGLMVLPVTFGQWLANLINILVMDDSNGWRISNAVSMIPPVIVMCGIFCVPESPRWTCQQKGREEAEAVLKRLRQTDDVRHELEAIGDQINQEETGNKGMAGLWEPTVRRRVFIAMALQLGQQATGINPIMTYGSLIFKDITGAGLYASLLLSGVNCLSTTPGLIWLDKYGRRYMAMIGAVGMVIGHLFAAILFTAICDGNVDDSGCPSVGGWFICLGTAFFVFSYAVSWGALPWIYCSEIFPLNVRASAVSVATAANWIGAAMTEVVKLFPYLNISGVFFMFAGLALLCGLFIYFYCPETKGIRLEDIETLFSRSYHTATSPSYGAVKTPVAATDKSPV
ncbi:Major Facilitator Superfamily (MFS) [Phytophthora infestans T30-4]|uniref:Hexose transporter 1 n=1 Tax=Phytophthora infestans (strain T30-4) TaxID=403677 RepID=D0MSV4_PHYIT|nr:Major Facilitator Superfamily (MFS) [Phytophthora infestans T30-4]EEY57538.1 Major Facilitator Superfamily (MFS) [Phytophthora infestans T30-4]|eukprot:XP_002908724.1 Major Facilitator Superfamily (MFS) [Phytophthora infestans T30-4]